MWLHRGSYVTSDSEIQHPSSPWIQVQVGLHPKDTESGGWSSDGTACAMGGLRPPEASKPEARGSVRGGRLGKLDMEEDVNKRERQGDCGI